MTIVSTDQNRLGNLSILPINNIQMNNEEKPDVYEKLYRLNVAAGRLITEGKRSPEALVELLGCFVDGKIVVDINWQKTYKALGMEKDYLKVQEELALRPYQGFWNMIVLQGLNPLKLVTALKNSKVNVQLDVEKSTASQNIIKNDRDPKNGTYHISLRRRIEADKENSGLSANTLKEREVHGVTILERLLLELGYFLTTGHHLDCRNKTLCTGSHDIDGNVFEMRWLCGESCVFERLEVRKHAPDHSLKSLRARSVFVL